MDQEVTVKEKDPFVFVVDDDAPICESLKDLISSAGLNVQTFASAQEFLASPRPDGPNCLVLDVQLPGLAVLICSRNWPEPMSRFRLFSSPVTATSR